MVEFQALVTISRQATLAMGLFGQKFLTQPCRRCELEDHAGAAPSPLSCLDLVLVYERRTHLDVGATL